MEKVYYGEVNCQGSYKSGEKKGLACENKAYHQVDDSYLCGVHAKKRGTPLPKNPRRQENIQQAHEEHEKECEEVAHDNLENGIQGQIAVAKLGMRKAVPHLPGYVKIFPNYKHGNRKDGFGCPSLSPKSLGPIEHGMTNLPVALNLENYHQGAKVFPGETKGAKSITRKAFETREQMYQDAIPYRHKFDVPYYTGEKIMKGNKNIPLFSVYYDKEGREHRYNYLESRYFYCHWYQKLAPQEKDFDTLVSLLENGFNLLLIGYDGYPVEKDLWEHYLDTSRPFGHELVLYTLLTIVDPEDYPWNRYYRQHKDIYEGVI